MSNRELLQLGKDISNLPKITVVIPMRNEENNVVACIESVMSQSYPLHQIQIIAVNDNSEDNTVPLIRELQKKYANLELVNAPKLPDGWVGKNFACFSGIKQASADWFVFMDADTMMLPELLVSVVNYSMQNKMDMLSLIPFQQMQSQGEKILLPGIFFAISLSMDFSKIANVDSPDSIANGQFIMFNAKSYAEMGGHEAIKNIVMEDMEFARRFKHAGKKTGILFADKFLHTRMYDSVFTVWKGFAKNMFEIMDAKTIPSLIYQTGTSLLQTFGATMFPVIAWILYQDGSIDSGIFFLALFSPLLLVSVWIASIVSYYKINVFYFIFFPLGILIHAILIPVSYYNKLKHHREWKGRFY